MQEGDTKLAIGHIVHYVLPGGRNRGEHRPAIVVKVWEEAAGEAVQLQVFTDSSNDFPTGPGSNGVLWAISVRHDEEQQQGTWHWPEEV